MLFWFLFDVLYHSSQNLFRWLTHSAFFLLLISSQGKAVGVGALFDNISTGCKCFDCFLVCVCVCVCVSVLVCVCVSPPQKVCR